MKLLCGACGHKQEAEHLAVRCEGCGVRGSMTFAPTREGWKPGEPMVGPSRVPHTRPPEPTMRGPYDEPLEVTRERASVYRGLLNAGVRQPDAFHEARFRVPVQCGRCGGEDAACPVCRGRATAPTAALAEARKPKAKRRRAKTG